MSDLSSGLPPAGWYPDPTGAVAGQKRWWDGGKWTADVQAPPAPAPQPPQFAPPAPPVYSSYIDNSRPDPRRDHLVRNIPSHASTLPGLLISITPFPQVAIIAAFYFIGTFFFATWFGVVGYVVAAFLTLLWAIQDRFALRYAGYEAPAHWAWMLLGPFWYLLFRMVRTRAEAGIGAAYLVRYLVSMVVAIIAFSIVVALAYPVALNNAATDNPVNIPSASGPPVASTVDYAVEVGNEIEADSRKNTAITYSVDCPGPIPEIGQNRVIRCIVVDPRDNRVGSTTVTMNDNPDGLTYTYDYTDFDFDN